MRKFILPTVFLTPCLIAFGQQNLSTARTPVFLRRAIQDGEKGDVFDKLKANDRAKFLRLPPPFSIDESSLMVMMKSKAEKKDPRALMYLGTVGYEDYGNPKGREQAKGLIKQAAELGSTKAQRKWAQIVWMDQKDLKVAEYWWNKAYQVIEEQAKLGDIDSMFELGNYAPPPGNQSGTMRILSQETTRTWLTKAAENGHIGAASMLGHVLDLTAKTEEEERDAWKWLNVAAEAGDAESMVALGRHYAKKKGGGSGFKFVPYDPNKAWEWWDKAQVLMGGTELWELLADLMDSGRLPPRPKSMPRKQQPVTSALK